MAIASNEENAGRRPRAGPSLAEASSSSGAGLREALAIWAFLAVETVLVLVTYARLPPRVLYHTSVGGLRGGLGRAVVELNFPIAVIALGLLAVALNVLLDGSRRIVYTAALAAVPMCALAAFVVHQKDLDARPVNAVPAVGVLIVAILTALAVRREGLAPTPRAAGDPLRVVLSAGVLLVSVPWLFALAGFYAPDPIYADERSPGEPLAAVHLGSHHGLYGVLLALAGLALSRALPAFRHRLLTAVTSALLALALAWGLANAFQDFEVEQLWKRGTVGWQAPSVLLPSLTWGWLAILVVAAAVELLWFRRERAGRRP